MQNLTAETCSVIPETSYAIHAALLGAALPIASNLFIVARPYDVYIVRTSRAILVSTVVSMISVSALLLVLH